MYSLNVPVPGEVRRLAADLRPSLPGRVREDLSLVCKRLDDDGPVDYPRLATRARTALRSADAAPFEARISGVDAFRDPVRGDGAVAYLAVESPGLVGIHRRLCDELGAVEDLEGDAYTPHVTLCRADDPGGLDSLLDRDVRPVTWTASELHLYDARHGEVAGRVSLPA